MVGCPALLRECFSDGAGSREGSVGGRAWRWRAVPHRWVKRRLQASSQGDPVGRCRLIRRAGEAILAAMLMSLCRMVALASSDPASVPARLRLNALTAQTSQAATRRRPGRGQVCEGGVLQVGVDLSMIA
jgi:hypothetical protein